MLKTLKAVKPVFIHGFIITVALVLIQFLLDAFQNSFLLYLPPIGFALFLVVQYIIQPIIMGSLNVVIIHRLYKFEDWQTGFWLNGLFLLLVFTTINVILETVTGLLFAPSVLLFDVFVLSYPFGLLGKFSNRGRKKAIQKTSVASPSP